MRSVLLKIRKDVKWLLTKSCDSAYENAIVNFQKSDKCTEPASSKNKLLKMLSVNCQMKDFLTKIEVYHTGKVCLKMSNMLAANCIVLDSSLYSLYRYPMMGHCSTETKGTKLSCYISRLNSSDFLNVSVTHLLPSQRGFKSRSSKHGLFSREKDSSQSLQNLFDKYMNGSEFKNMSDDELGRLIIASANADKTNMMTYVWRGFKKTVFYFAIACCGISLLSAYLVSKMDGVISEGEMNISPGRQQFEVSPKDIKVRFSDVKGADEAKRELQEIVDFLRDPAMFTRLGAKLPKGVLLIGQPGIGKTLLARAVAGEAGVSFFQISGSEFEEVFVGVGAKRIRQLFNAARLRAPCVIFIDEIDSVGTKRINTSIHPYANQTVNQLLSAMDGFTQNEGIIVLGATNSRDNLDKALLRPGRFDVEVQLSAPDVQGRKEILALYLGKISVDSGINIDMLARRTTGFTGADLSNMVNQAALKAAMLKSPIVTLEHLEYARDKIIMGPAKTRLPNDMNISWNTAYHEAGHAVVAYFTKHSTPLHKVTIVPRGNSLGHTSFIPESDVYSRTKAQLMAQIDVILGGRVAEELIYGPDHVTTGASNDIKIASATARAMVMRYGMSDKVGLVFLYDLRNSLELSPKIKEEIDCEIKRYIQESYDRAKSILVTHSREHKALAQALMKYETLNAEQITAVMNGKSVV